MLTRICTVCGRKVEQGKTCSCQSRRQKEYDRDNRDKKSAAFYHSKSWRLLREAVKARAQFADEYILHYEHKIVEGRIAHHIIPVHERPDLALNARNIVYVSDKTHKMIHDAYDRGEEDKREMQAKLARIRIDPTGETKIIF